MKTKRVAVWLWGVCSLAAASASAQTTDATMRVQLSVASSSQGVFNFSGRLAARVGVFARSGFQARLSSATGLEGPTSGTAGPGASFFVDVPRLYTARAAGASNPYTVELSWADTTPRTASFGPYNLNAGQNNIGPLAVTNDAPPAPSSISCYPNPPNTSSELYVYWSGPSPRPSDFDRFELHRSTLARFTPNSGTLVAMLPWGSSNRAVTGLPSGTGQYFCIRIYDQYGAFSDRCTSTPCTTASASVDAGAQAPDAGPSDAGSSDLRPIPDVPRLDVPIVEVDSGASGDAGASNDLGAANDTGAVSDTGAANDTGAVSDTGAANDTGAVSDTGAANDTGAVSDTGAVNVDSGSSDGSVSADAALPRDVTTAVDSATSGDATAAVDATTQGDATSAPDAMPPSGDASASADVSDASPTVTPGTNDGGCGCRVGGPQRAATASPWALVGLAALCARRRRKI